MFSPSATTPRQCRVDTRRRCRGPAQLDRADLETVVEDRHDLWWQSLGDEGQQLISKVSSLLCNEEPHAGMFSRDQTNGVRPHSSSFDQP